MPVPTITAFPAYPSRVGDTTNFYAESLAFLEAQPDFVTEANSIASYFSTIKFNVNNWGLITDAVGGGGSAVLITNLPDSPPTNPPLTGYALTLGIDDLLASLSGAVSEINATCSYIDGLNDPLGEVDPLAPAVSTVADSPLRTDAIATFNTKAVSFYSSARSFCLALNDLADYVTDSQDTTKDWGLLTEAITVFEDWGTVTA